MQEARKGTERSLVTRVREIAVTDLTPADEFTAHMIVNMDRYAAAKIAALPPGITDPVTALRAAGLESTADALHALLNRPTP